MSFKRIALTAIVAAAFVAPGMTAANAGKKHHKKHDRIERLDYDDDIHNVRLGNTRTRGIDRRINRQHRRIRNGRIDGDLTFREYRKLRRGLNRIRRARHYAKADGHVSRYERRELRDMLSDHSERIYRLRNNNRTAFKPLLRYTKKFY